MTIETNIPFGIGVLTGILAAIFIITREHYNIKETLGTMAIYIIGKVVASMF